MSNFSLAVTLAGANTLPLDRKYFNVTFSNCARVKVKNQITNETTVELSYLLTITIVVQHIQPKLARQIILQLKYKRIMQRIFICLVRYVQIITLKQLYLQFKWIHSLQRDIWESNPPKLQGVVASAVQKFITVVISVCRNSTTYNGCPPIEEIQEHMKSGYYAVLMNDNLLDMGNPTSPINQMMLVYKTTFSISTSRSIYQTFKIIDFITDFGLISHENKQVQGIIQNQWSETSEYYTEDNQLLYKNQYF